MLAKPFLARLAVLAVLFAAIGSAHAQEKTTATIKILLPDNLYHNAEVKIDNVLTKATGSERTFVTPMLDPKKKYEYTIEAVIEPNNYTKITRTRKIEFKAGDEVTVDLRKKDEKTPDNVTIRFVPTPDEIAKAMCKLANVGKDDVVADCGCGNGILIITAVKDFGAKKGIGIDIDPERVKETKEAVAKAGLMDKITISEGNALKLTSKEIGDATVIMTYMGNELNIRFRPILWEALKPGTRIVSHRFVFGDWKPEKTINVKGNDGEEYTLHLWTITGKEKEGKYDKTDKEAE